MGDFLNFFFFFLRKRIFFYLGWQFILHFIPRFFFISNIKILKFKYVYFSTVNGAYSQITEIYKDLNLIKIKLSSGKKKILHETNICTLGRNNNIFQKYSILGSFSINHSLGRKSSVRGVAMNPVDHPHGGRTKTNKPEVSP